MANTRDKNSQANYTLEQKGLGQIRDHLLFINGPSGHGYNAAFPELYMNGKMPADNLSCNSVDIESRLFGININNLVKMFYNKHSYLFIAFIFNKFFL